MAFACVKRCYAKFRATYHLEFHMLLFFLSSMILTSAAYPLYYTKVCQSVYPTPTDPSQIYVCDDFQAIQSDDLVQRRSTDWMMYGEVAKFFPNIFGSMFLGSYGDHYGRKTPTLISVVSFLTYFIFYWIFVTAQVAPLYAITIMAAVTSLGGTLTVFLSALFSEAADYEADKGDHLTVRYAVLTAFWSGAIVISGNVAPFMMTYIGYEWTIFVGLSFIVASFFSVLFLFPVTNPSALERKRLLNVQISNEENGRRTPSSNSSSTIEVITTNFDKQIVVKWTAFGWLKEGLALYKSAWLVLSKKRPNSGRTRLIVYCIVVLIYACEDSGMDNITVLYIYYKPLSWSPQLYSWWSAAMAFCQLVGSVGSAFLFKRIRLSDTTILLISLFSAAIKMTGIGIGHYTWLMFASLLLGCLSTVGFSAIRSLVVQLGGPEETGELMSVINLFMAFCTLFSALVYNNIYSASLDFYPGFPWLLEAALLLCCIVAILLVNFIPKKSSALEDVETDKAVTTDRY